jgi:transcriptional regulator with XRE-family HTH domain
MRRRLIDDVAMTAALDGIELRDDVLAETLRDAHPVRLAFARNLHRLRWERGPQKKGSYMRTVTALAEKVGIAPAYLSQLENGVREPSLTMVARLADALAVPISALLDVPVKAKAPRTRRRAKSR